MPAAKKKKRNNKPKSVNKKIITIHQSSPTFQSQETTSRPPLNLSDHQQEQNQKPNSAMEDKSSSNGIVEQEYKEVAVEDVGDGDSKTSDSGEGSILDKIVAVAEEVLHVGGGSSSSSSSDDEGERPEPKAAAEDEVETGAAVENFVSIVEAKLESVVSDHDEAKDSSASAVSPFSEVKIAEAEAEAEEVVSKVVEENDCVVVSSEPPSESVDDVHIDQIPETAANPVASGVCVTRESLQAASWKSCCGLFEVLRRSGR